jgi:dTDP-glucose pyrophosphorylase
MKAIVTAGGKGSRLSPITRAYPKELIQFCGIPVIEYGINLLRDSGIEDIFIVAGTKKGALQDYLGNGEIFGVNVAYLIQEQPKGLGHSVLMAEHYIDDDFVLLLGDTIITGEEDLKQMIEVHKKYGASITVLVEHVKDPERYGVVKFDDSSKIISLYEKPREQKIKDEFKINDGWYAIVGLYIINKNIFNFIKETKQDINNEIQLTDAIKLSLEKGNIIMSHILKGKRIDVGGWDYLKEERNFYVDMSDDKLNDIIKSRYNKMMHIKSAVATNGGRDV